MDGLSGAASGIAVVSLTLQIVESISKLHDFFESMQGAPASVAAIRKDLGQLSSILDSLMLDEERFDDVLATCMDKIAVLSAIIEDLEPGFQSRSHRNRKWTAFRTARKGIVLKNFRETLEETKTTMVLALQAKHLLASQTSVSQLNSQLTMIERRICEDRIASQSHVFELISKQEQLSGSVNSMADQLAELSVERNLRLISIESEPVSLSNHIADLQEEIGRMITTISNPMARRTFAASLKATVDSHLNTIDEHSLSQQPSFFSRRDPDSESEDETANSQVDHHISNQSSTKRIASPSVHNAMRKRRRVRCTARSTVSIKDFFGGRIYVQTDSYHVTAHVSSERGPARSPSLIEHETIFAYRPAEWLLRRGFLFGVNALIVKAAQGWKYQVRSFRAVPDSSLVFEFCRTDNLDAVRSLLVRREASPWDVNSWGWNPLHIAARGCHVEICKLLLREGAEPNAMTYRFNLSRRCRPLSAFTVACEGPIRTLFDVPNADLDKNRLLATLKLLFQYVELEVEHDDGTSFFEDLVGRASKFGDPNLEFEEPLKWAFEACRVELKDEDLRPILVGVLIAPLERHIRCISTIKLILKILDTDVDDALEPNGFSYLHYSIPHQSSRSEAELLEFMEGVVELGANIHRVGYDVCPARTFRIPGLHSPTSIAMRDSASFFYWREVLLRKRSSLPLFVVEELQTSPLASQGWTKDSLLALFGYDFAPYMATGDMILCQRCARLIYFGREVPWENMLEMIKQGRMLEVQGPEHRTVLGRHSRKSEYLAAGLSRSMNSDAGSADQDDHASVSGDDESVDNDTTSRSGNWPWQSLCDWCEMEFESASTQDESEEEENFIPRMPGGFHVQ